ncbi:unnamed protein product [Mycena citricolor]|uniref:Uncharacterized protein n=1 Tax=Mycena citricolor TaxID=2018698 RepID=A0AAD2HEN8_9AGAR|nr:unnamed protein product [Mycena citricolor]
MNTPSRNTEGNADLPTRKEPLLRTDVKKPLASTRLNRLIYLLILLSTAMSAYYTYRVVQWKTDVGGWWNLAMGVRPPTAHSDPRPNSKSKSTPSSETVEDRISALADALGMPSADLASAIAGAVRAYVPPASLSSIAVHQTGEAVKVLLDTDPEAGAQQGAGDDAGYAATLASGMGSFVGMDEP